jgi:hypothetical protein
VIGSGSLRSKVVDRSAVQRKVVDRSAVQPKVVDRSAVQLSKNSEVCSGHVANTLDLKDRFSKCSKELSGKRLPDLEKSDLGSSENTDRRICRATKWPEPPNDLSGSPAKCEGLVIPADSNAELRMNSPRPLP